MVLENNHAPEAAKIQDELVLFVKYKEREGAIKTITNVDADASTRESTRMARDNFLDSLSSCDMYATNRVAAVCSPKDATDDPTNITSTTAE